jgi:hypothetical protein
MNFKLNTVCYLIVFLIAYLSVFYLDQDYQLGYYPLNDPSDGFQYIQIVCKTNYDVKLQIILKSGSFYINNKEIIFDIKNSNELYIYTFPLFDSPLSGLKFEINNLAKLDIQKLSILDRGKNEVFNIINNGKINNGKVISASFNNLDWHRKGDKFISILSFKKITIPVDMNIRNMQRCIISVLYLSLIIYIIQVYLINGKKIIFIYNNIYNKIILSILISIICNRGLLHNSCYYFIHSLYTNR